MPVQAQRRHPKRLSAYFYAYGRKCGSRAVINLLISLIFIFIFSYPILSRSIPSNRVDDVEGHFWQHSSYLQPGNSSTSDNTPEVIIQQIRIVNDKRNVNVDLLLQAQAIQVALRTRSIMLDGKPVSLDSICVLRHHQCIIHSPLEYWQNQDVLLLRSAADTNAATRDWAMHINTRQLSNSSGLSMHPRSVFGNVTLDNDGQFVSADSVILTLLLQKTPFLSTAHVWDALWRNVTTDLHINSLVQEQEHAPAASTTIHAWQIQVNMRPSLVHYNFKPLPFRLSIEAYLYFAGYFALCFLVSTLFGSPHLVRSQFAQGFATIFTMLACYTTTRGILEYLNLQLTLVPWYLQMIVPIVSSLENMFLLTNAVLSAGCDMQVKEKTGRGIESVGVPITLTLIAEWLILAIGSSMHIPQISEFCLFARTSLLVGYLIDMTFGLSFLAINVKYVELTDLDDRQTSKRLRELAKCDVDTDIAPDFCPIQEPQDDSTPKTCAECKHFKTHRTYNALMLCLIILTLTIVRPTTSSSMAAHNMNGNDMYAVSTRFWTTVNPLHQRMSVQVNPPYLVMYASTPSEGTVLSQQLEKYYQSKAFAEQQHKPTRQLRQTSRFRKALLTCIYEGVSLLVRINFPSVLLTLVLIGIVMWLVPSLQEKWLQPFRQKLLENIQRGLSILVKLMTRSFADYDENGIHRGAISAQERFNHQQLEHNIGNVIVKTLSGRHVADIRRLAINAKYGTVVSCGQDGRIVVWDADKAEWVARLDRIRHTHSEIMEADLNTAYWSKRDRRQNPTSNKGHATDQQMRSARCIKVDQGNKWIGAGFDDGIVRIWKISSGTLMREMAVETPISGPSADGVAIVRQRRHYSGERQHNEKRAVDRVIAIQFIGTVTEHCHPLVAEAAAKQRQSKGGNCDDSSQNYIVSIHKSGTIREWDILSGQCIQSFPSGHSRDITVLHVAECKAPHRKLGVTWIFTASKDGVIKCWERRLIKPDIDIPEASTHEAATSWICIYTIDGHGGHAITTLATEVPVGGMGVLVSGASDGAVKVWNFETGDEVCTLSRGGVKRKDTQVHMGGPLLKFSKFSTDDARYGASAGGIGRNDDPKYELPATDSANHHGPVTQVVVTRYCEVENGPGLCRGCDTCFGNGFGIASCALDDAVHVWRLERADGTHEGSCTLCTKNYHQKRYTRTRPQVSTTTDEHSDPKGQRRRAGTLNGTRRVYGIAPASAAVKTMMADDQTTADGLLDIEQLGDESNIVLEPVFLGKIRQLAGRGLVFCNNMVLAGVRKNPTRGSLTASAGSGNDWEAWFASLKYYINKNDMTYEIPVETFDLEPQSSQRTTSTPLALETTRSTDTSMLSFIKHFIWGAGGNASDKNKKMKAAESDDEYERDYDEANELLPFSIVRHVAALDGSGIACDYGNFIKLVYLDDAERKLHEFAQGATTAITTVAGSTAADQVMSKGGGNNGACGSSNANKQCCGGSNKKGGGGSCCSDTTKRRTRRRAPGETRRISCQSDGDCSSNTNCSRSPASSSKQPSTAWKWQ